MACFTLNLDPALDAVERRLDAGERLDAADGLALLETPDLLGLGRLASSALRRRAGDQVYFINNRHINHTNVCKNRCSFCAFSRDDGEPGAYTMALDEVLARAAGSAEEGVTELHIVGGEHPGLPYSYYRDMIFELRRLAPRVQLTAFTASEIAHFAEISGLSVEEVLLDLKAAGLDTLPGGGAEVFSARVRALVCPKKISGEKWIEVHKAAHRCGLPTNATMLYGHVETVEERVDHLLRLRDAQDETGGFQAFIPLAFHPRNTGLAEYPGPTGVEDLKMLATARLLLDNFAHVKAYWVMVGLKLAQVGLFFGVDDLDGTIVEETITHAAGGETEQAVARDELIRLVKDAGREPVERDAFYHVLGRFE